MPKRYLVTIGIIHDLGSTVFPENTRPETTGPLKLFKYSSIYQMLVIYGAVHNSYVNPVGDAALLPLK